MSFRGFDENLLVSFFYIVILLAILCKLFPRSSETSFQIAVQLAYKNYLLQIISLTFDLSNESRHRRIMHLMYRSFQTDFGEKISYTIVFVCRPYVGCEDEERRMSYHR